MKLPHKIKRGAKYALVGLFLLGLVGCCTPEIIYKDRIVEVPKIIHVQPPAPPKVQCGVIPVDSLKHGDEADAVAKAYVSSVRILKNCREQYEAALEPYKKASEK